MLVSRTRKRFIFIHIYKNAGTSIVKALLPYTLNSWQRLANRRLQRFGIYFDSQPYPDHSKASEVVSLMGRERFAQYFSFAFVRNPWDWQVSLYVYTLKTPEHRQHEFFQSFNGFDDYIRWRCAEEVRFQKDFIYSDDGELLVNYVGRFENLQDDFAEICRRIGITASLPHLNSSKSKPYQTYYTEETRDLVRRTFEPDISLFQYEF